MRATKEDIRKEKIIIRKKDFKPRFSTPPSKGIFITGANSFIGVHVIQRIINTTDLDCYLLVRAMTTSEAWLKMQDAFSFWGLGVFPQERIYIVTGDVLNQNMGLSEKNLRTIKEKTGSVVHLAMTPLYHFPYSHFKRIWIPELENMINFCGDKEYPKVLHYTSSFNANFFIDEDDFAALNTNAWQSGYAGFKWVAEKAIKNAMTHGLRATTYNIPLVLGSEAKGLCPKHYSIWMILDMFLKSGYYFDFNFKIIPVDILAKVIVMNIMAGIQGEEEEYIRPALQKNITNSMLSHLVGSLIGLQKGNRLQVRMGYNSDMRFDFMIPSNFNLLLEKCNSFHSIWPEWYDKDTLPDTTLIFIRNLNKALSRQNILTI